MDVKSKRYTYISALEDIISLSINYDNTDDLKSLVDDMAMIAEKAIKGEKWTTNIPTDQDNWGE